MGILAADAILKTAIELGLEDLRANDWLLDDVFSDFTTNPYLKVRYGQKQVDAAKEWFKNNKINLSLAFVSDRMELPHVVIVLGTQNEKTDMKTMGDASTETVVLLPTQIKKPIPFIVNTFTPLGYDESSGVIDIDPNLPGLVNIAAGMILADTSTGQGWVIQDATADSIVIEAGLAMTATHLAVLPKNQFYTARVEHSFSQASYSISCTAHGDPQTAIWLHDVILYCLYRYRESLLEANGMAETVFQSAQLKPSNLTGDGGDLAFERTINISTQIEQSWIKSPMRIVETVNLREKKDNGYIGGISVLSNLDAQDFEDTWYTDTPETAEQDFLDNV